MLIKDVAYTHFLLHFYPRTNILEYLSTFALSTGSRLHFFSGKLWSVQVLVHSLHQVGVVLLLLPRAGASARARRALLAGCGAGALLRLFGAGGARLAAGLLAGGQGIGGFRARLGGGRGGLWRGAALASSGNPAASPGEREG